MEREYKSYWLAKGSCLEGKYRIVDVIAEGGMGIVYLGYDTLLQNYVSIKEFFPRWYAMRSIGEEHISVYEGECDVLFHHALDEFVNESRILVKFESLDSIVMVKDLFFANGTAYMVMEHVEGENIKEYVERKGAMDPQEVLELMRPILCSLNELHKAGVIHRDISPDNIILSEKGKAVLIDFGAARFLNDQGNQGNQTMTVFFKRGYSAKEQYMEESRKGAFTDVYGVCATMYFMLTGIRPEESIRRMIHDTVIPLYKFKSIKLQDSQKRSIMRGMSVDAEKRYSSLEDLCRHLYIDQKKGEGKFLTAFFVVLFWIVIAGITIGHFLTYIFYI